MTRSGLVASLALAALSLLANPARAEQKPLWELGMGAAGLHLPHYRGSDQTHDWLLPTPYVIYRGDFLKADRDGARAVLVQTSRVDVDLSLGATAPTRSSDDEARRGMSDLAPTLEFGPNVNFTLARGTGWKLDLRTPLRAAFTLESHPRNIGWVFTPNLNLDITDWHGWNFGAQVGPEFGDRRYHGYYYDVKPEEATATRAAYTAPGGAAGARLTLAAARRFTHWWAGAFLRLDTLRGASFLDSPLVRQRENTSFGVALVYVFANSSTLVDVDE
ncbi:MAG TPA: MipA/OmpV family protein [Burkholderiaceae bacterium]|jgi:outer membrane scaffolding protein for murein synthesis (MipA/OmpV family)|nr:MipA/OmpV family protein [Burkholderiaceae bacterium]